MIILLKHVVVEELVHQVVHIHLAVGVNFTTRILTYAAIGCIYEATAQDVVQKGIQNVMRTVVYIILSLLTTTIHIYVALGL